MKLLAGNDNYHSYFFATRKFCYVSFWNEHLHKIGWNNWQYIPHLVFHLYWKLPLNRYRQLLKIDKARSSNSKPIPRRAPFHQFHHLQWWENYRFRVELWTKLEAINCKMGHLVAWLKWCRATWSHDQFKLYLLFWQ